MDAIRLRDGGFCLGNVLLITAQGSSWNATSEDTQLEAVPHSLEYSRLIIHLTVGSDDTYLCR